MKKYNLYTLLTMLTPTLYGLLAQFLWGQYSVIVTFIGMSAFILFIVSALRAIDYHSRDI